MFKTTRIRLDRISSSTRNAQLSAEVIIGDEIVAAEGYVLAVRILHETFIPDSQPKAVYAS